MHRRNSGNEFSEVRRGINAPIKPLVLWRHREHLHLSRRGEFPNQRLKGNIRPGQGRNEVRRSLARINRGQRLRSFANIGTTPQPSVARSNRNCSCSRVTNGISTASTTRCEVCICQRFRQTTQRAAGWRLIQKQFSVIRQPGGFGPGRNENFLGTKIAENSSCRRQSGSSRKTTAALSRPIRRDSPPASSTARRKS